MVKEWQLFDGAQWFNQKNVGFDQFLSTDK